MTVTTIFNITGRKPLSETDKTGTRIHTTTYRLQLIVPLVKDVEKEVAQVTKYPS